jgi:predicted metal-dependent hydrolase
VYGNSSRERETTARLALALPSISYRILASAGAAQDLGAWRGLIRFVFGRGGMLRRRWRAVTAYHRRNFHSWRYLDYRRVLSELRDTIVDPAWEVSAR